MGLPMFNRGHQASAAPKKNRRVQQVRPREAPAAVRSAPARKPAIDPARGGARLNRRVQGSPRAGSKPAVQGPREGLRALASAMPRPRLGASGRRLLGLFGRVAVALALAWGVLLAAQAAYNYVTTSSRFEAKSLVFEATPHVPVERLQELMAIEPGTNILSVEVDALRDKIEAEPWVARAEVQRSLPDTLIVAVEEHEAAAVLLSGYFYLIDREGVPFKRVEGGERGELPVITGVDREQLVQGDPRATAAIRRGLDALAAYQAKARPRLSEIHVAEGGAVSLYTAKTGAALRLGRGELADKLARYDALRAALGERADRLAVVHLDLESRGASERVVASFLDAGDEAAVLAAPRAGGAEPAAQPAGAKDSDKKTGPEDHAPGKPAKVKGKPVKGKKQGDAHSFPSGIPRYD